ncbi:MAG: aldehyde dehydrogenase family protein, partial [Micromonosporaceae bacterium]|nr:aldehyde dehydrogenase family protein [Micromonosporaceae bacterium]
MREIETILVREWETSPARDWIERTDPADGSLVARIPVSTPEQVTAAVRAAREAASGWARTPAATRGA